MTVTLRTSSSALAVAAALALLAGCASNKSADAPAAASAPAAAPAPAPAPAPAKPANRAELDYGHVTDAAQGANTARLKKALAGKTVLLNLSRAQGPGAPAAHYMANAGDRVFFRCRTSAPGFQGGEVVARIQDARVEPKARRSIVDLDRCAPDAVEAPAAAPAPRAAAPAPAPAPAPEPASAAGSGTAGAGKPGMDARGNVVDSSKVESGSGRTVKGMNGYEGEITGNPARNSKFTNLQIGMGVRQVTDIAGQPTDQGAYITGKAWIPFYFGGDRHRFEMTYKGQGRLIFAGGGMGDFSNGYLIWIIHNPNEAGYR